MQTGSHSQLSREIWAPTARIGDLTHPVQPRGHLQKHILKTSLGGGVKVFVAFFFPLCSQRLPACPRSSDAMAAAFQHFARGQLPSAIPLHSIPSAPHSPPPPRSILLPRCPACAPQPSAPYLHHRRHHLHHHRRGNYSPHNCVLSLRQSLRSAREKGQDLKSTGIEGKVQGERPPKNKERRLLERKGKWRQQEETPERGQMGTCQTPAVSQLPFSRLETV